MKKIFISASIILGLAAVASAQNTQTAFFLDNYVYSYRINPAKAYSRNFVGIVLNNYDVSTQSSLGVSNFLFPTESGLLSAYNKAVTPEQFLSGLPDSGNLYETLDVSILSAGWWTKKNSFCTLELNIHEAGGFAVPKDLFAFAKCGSSDIPYDLSNLTSSLNAYADIAFGYTRAIGSRWTVGGRAKLLVGLARASAGFDKALLSVNDKSLTSEVDASFKIASPLVDIPLKEVSERPESRIYDFSKLSFDARKMGVGGWGFALDLGATFKPVKGLELSASILNLGGIAWKNNVAGHSSAVVKYTGLIEETSTSSDMLSNTSNIIKESLDNIMAVVDMEPVEANTSFEMLPVVFNAGARYAMPFYDKLSAGLLVSGRTGLGGFFDARAAATISPIHWFSFTANVGGGTFGPAFGSGLSVSAGPFNLFAAFDGYIGKFSPLTMKFGEEIAENDGMNFKIPVKKFHFNLNFGITIVFGARHDN